MDYKMVSLTKEMLSDLAELEKLCFSVPWSENMFAGELENSAAVYRVFLYEDKPVAYMGMWLVADEGQITNVAVHPDHRRRGLAKELIGTLINIAKGEELGILTLEVRASNQSAINLYKSFGFYQVGLRKNYYEGKEDALLMTLDIHEEEGKGENKS